VFVELHARSAFSFLEAAALPEALAERAAKLDQPAIALLDVDGVYGAQTSFSASTSRGRPPAATVRARTTSAPGRAPRVGTVIATGAVQRSLASSGGENVPSPNWPGSEAMMPPPTPLLAGIPTR
jgi:hypothetical protein